MNKKPGPKILAVTNRQLCRENFLQRIEKLAQTAIDGVILREKDLPASDYETLAKEVLIICRRYGKKCILHSFPDAASRLAVEDLHLPLRTAAGYKDLHSFKHVGISVHSREEAQAALALGAAYVTAGHIFATGCKPDLPPRGLTFLAEICAAVPLPVFAIGGINETNLVRVLEAGATGVCLMSPLMTCADPQAYVDRLTGILPLVPLR